MAVLKINWNPTLRELRNFSLVSILFFGVVAWIAYSKTGSLVLPAIILAVGLAMGIVGTLAPAFIRPIYVVWMAAVFPIGWVVSHTVLAIVFYLVFTPVGLLMRLFGHDPMQRRFDRAAKTYWLHRPPQGKMSRYFRQY